VPAFGQITLTFTYLTCSVALAVLGVTWVAFARGTKLAIQVEAAGGSETGVAQLVLARLSELGSERPRGIRTAEQSDISELPTDALTDVPTGALATALFNILRVIRPGRRYSTSNPSRHRLHVLRITPNPRVIFLH